MDTAIIITGFIGLASGLVLGAIFWVHHADTVNAQAEEIAALQADNLLLRGQCTELATLAHTADAEAHGAITGKDLAIDIRNAAMAMLEGEIDAHRATKRKLSAAKGQITKLRKAMGANNE